MKIVERVAGVEEPGKVERIAGKTSGFPLDVSVPCKQLRGREERMEEMTFCPGIAYSRIVVVPRHFMSYLAPRAAMHRKKNFSGKTKRREMRKKRWRVKANLSFGTIDRI